MKTVAFFLLLVSSSLTRSTKLTLNVTSNIQFVKIDTKVFKIVLDESSASSDGVLFVGAQNQILKINASTLTLVDSKRESSLFQSNDYTVISIHNTSHIITCGTINYGMCSMREKDDLSKFSLIGDPNLAQNHVASKKSTLFFPIKTSPDDSSNSYVIGHEYDDRAEDISPPTLSVRKIQSSPNLSFNYLREGSKRSAINIPRTPTTAYRIEYIFGFYDENYFYVISNHILVDARQNEPRIARVCLTDVTMTTFAELWASVDRPFPLLESDPYGTVTAAHYQSNGSNVTSELYIIFSDRQDANKSFDSYIVSIDMETLNDYFNNIIDGCMRGDESTLIYLNYYTGLLGPLQDKRCVAMNWTKNYCEPRSTNFYIASEDTHDLTPSQILYNSRITSFATYISNNCVIALIGTYTGEIIKMRWADPSIELFRYDFSFSSHPSADRKIQPNPVIDEKQNFAYFAVSNYIIKFPLQSCSIYTRCSKCISVNDPLGCGWCGNQCVRKNECDTALSEFCRPVIDDFYPKTGPAGGGTKITILGDNFGTQSTNRPLRVYINGLIPPRNLDIRENEKIVCTTIPSEPISKRVQIFVDAGEQVVGGQSDSYFSFLQFNVSGISPSFSTKLGGSLFKITGRNLHIGGTRSIKIITSGERQRIMANCNIREVSENEIKCMMGPFVDWNVTIGYLSVTIDWDQKHTDIRFEFKDNPVVTEISPSEIEPSGNINITITGRNLDSIAFPVLHILSAVDHHKNVTVPCATINPKRLNCGLHPLDAFWSGKYATMHLGDNTNSINYSRKYAFHFRSSVLIPGLIITGVIFALGAAVAYCCFKRCCFFKFCYPSKKEYAAVEFTSDHQANMYPEDARSLDYIERTNVRALDSDKEYQELISQLRASKKFITREYLTLDQLIGEGYFSSVHKGTLEEPEGESKEVAIKTLKNTSYSEVKAFLREAVNMKDLGHENVLSLIGVAFSADANIPELVLPFMSNGDVLSYVRGENNEPTVRQLLTFTLDIARGMKYLSDQKIVHRDLAARNCILDDDFVARVSDFGLSRDVYEKNYYCSDKRAPLPYKWMAIESIQKGTFTSKSDVWSYGVTSWEVMTRGQLPYQGVENSELKDHLLSRNRLQIPLFCPQPVYNLWTRCWLNSADERPTFTQIIDEIEHFFRQIAKRSPQEKVSDSGYANIANGIYYNGTDDVNDLRQIVPIGNCYS